MSQEISGNEHASSRRAFIKTAAATAAVAVAPGAANAQEKAPRRLRIGAACVGEYSFMSFCWSDIMEPDKATISKGGTFGTPFLNMDITHVWDVNPAEAQKFAARMGAVAVKNYDDMVGKVDGVIFGGFYEVPWQHLLARPYVEAGIPVYLSRPFAYRLRDMDELLNLAAKHNTAIIATAKHEHYHEAPALKSRLKSIGPIQCVQATCWASDFPIHFHTQFMLLKIFGYDVDKVSVITDKEIGNNYLQETYIFKGWEGQKPFICSLQNVMNQDSFSIDIIGRDNTVSAKMVRSPSWQDSLLFRYAPQVIDMQRTFDTKKSYEPLDILRKKTEIFLTGYYSLKERNGAPVTVGQVSTDWQAPLVKPNWIDMAMFKKG
ncbi:MAG: Gfo/Idh/MocA family oxidoreductase [Candidatus Latescibacter sp.]|nr:Gfo/Idh/MocA family oxidoreductase [Candidatus Latescibacter sp.]